MAFLGQFDVRTIEHLIKKNEEYPLPHHLRHLAIISEVMHYGRECRTEYWTKSVLQRSRLDPDAVTEKLRSVLAEDLSDTAGFAEYSQEDFHDGDPDILAKFVDSFGGTTGKRNRKGGVKPDGSAKNRNPILSDGTVKKGRPRKEWSVSANIIDNCGKTDAASPKRRRRPPKERSAVSTSPKSLISARTATQGDQSSSGRSRRGRSAKPGGQAHSSKHVTDLSLDAGDDGQGDMNGPTLGAAPKRASQTRDLRSISNENSCDSQQMTPFVGISGGQSREQPLLSGGIETIPSSLVSMSFRFEFVGN